MNPEIYKGIQKNNTLLSNRVYPRTERWVQYF